MTFHDLPFRKKQVETIEAVPSVPVPQVETTRKEDYLLVCYNSSQILELTNCGIIRKLLQLT